MWRVSSRARHGMWRQSADTPHCTSFSSSDSLITRVCATFGSKIRAGYLVLCKYIFKSALYIAPGAHAPLGAHSSAQPDRVSQQESSAAVQPIYIIVSQRQTRLRVIKHHPVPFSARTAPSASTHTHTGELPCEWCVGEELRGAGNVLCVESRPGETAQDWHCAAHRPHRTTALHCACPATAVAVALHPARASIIARE